MGIRREVAAVDDRMTDHLTFAAWVHLSRLTLADGMSGANRVPIFGFVLVGGLLSV
jgi:hypothetical protein